MTAQIPESMTVDIGTVIARTGDEWTVDGEVWTPPASDDGSGDAAASGDGSGDTADGGDGSGAVDGGDGSGAVDGGDGSGDTADGGDAVTTDETTDETEPEEGPEYGSNIFGLENAFSEKVAVRWPTADVDADGNPVFREMGDLTLANGWSLGEGADAETEFFVMLHFLPTEAEKAAFETMTFSWAMSGFTEQEVDGVQTLSVNSSAEVMRLTPTFIPGDQTVIFDYDYAKVDQTGTAAHSDLTALDLDTY